MKRTILSLLSLGTGCLLIQSASASLLFTEAFNYTTPGNLGGNVNPGSGYTWGPGNTYMQVGSGNLTYPGLVDLGGNDLSVTWGQGSGTAGSITNGFANVTSGTLFYSFLLDMTTLPTANSYLTSINPGTSTPSGSSDAMSLYFGTITGGGGVRFGLRGGGASTVYTSSTSPYLANTTYFIVMEYDLDATANNMTMYINPTPGGAQPGADLTLSPSTGFKATSLDNVGFKVQSGPAGAFLIDTLRVGTTWGDVTPTPEPSTIALAGLGALSLVLARRMRQ
jgi:hypothetical protein